MNFYKAKEAVLVPLIIIAAAFLIGAVLILPTGSSPVEAYTHLFRGAFVGKRNIFETLARSTPLIFTGIGAVFAFKGGVFNIGLEGQMHMGALGAALAGVYIKGVPVFIHLPLCIAAAMLFSGLWGALVGYFHARFRVNVVIMSIMTNYIAMLLCGYLVTYPFRGEIPVAATLKVLDSAVIPKFIRMSALNYGFILAVIMAVFLYYLINKTSFGYELRATGQNKDFAAYMGIDVKRNTILIMVISAMMAGLAGAEQVLGVTHRFYDGFSPGYGFTGITVGLLASLNPIGAVVSGLFFGALDQGSLMMETMTSVSRDLIETLQGIMIILLAIQIALKLRPSREKNHN